MKRYFAGSYVRDVMSAKVFWVIIFMSFCLSGISKGRTYMCDKTRGDN